MRRISTDVAIVGGGIMGLLTAYLLQQAGKTVAIIDSGKIGGVQAASSGLTRSVRNDYADPLMAAMAYEAFNEWQRLESEWGIKVIVPSGCLNIFNSKLTDIKLTDSYAAQALQWLERDGRATEEFKDKSALGSKYSQLVADYAVLDVDAGLALASTGLQTVYEILTNTPVIEIFEDTAIRVIDNNDDRVLIETDIFELTAEKLVITAGLGTPAVTSKLSSSYGDLPIKADRPFELKYFLTTDKKYKPEELPVFAFLDVGIYGHPVIDGATPGVKIGYYRPPGVRSSPASAGFIDRFVSVCLPGLARTSGSEIVTEVDQCSYDMTPDNRFVLGYYGPNENIVMAAGFNGTGFKFAPVIAGILSDLVAGRQTAYDISSFSPNRFDTRSDNNLQTAKVK